MKKILLSFCIVLLASSAYAAQVIPEDADKLPAIPKGLSISEAYTSGPSPYLKQTMSSEKFLAKLIPDNWKVYCEKGILKHKQRIKTDPENNWFTELDIWLNITNFRALVSPKTHEVFVRKSIGGYI